MSYDEKFIRDLSFGQPKGSNGSRRVSRPICRDAARARRALGETLLRCAVFDNRTGRHKPMQNIIVYLLVGSSLHPLFESVQLIRMERKPTFILLDSERTNGIKSTTRLINRHFKCDKERICHR
jgi:hypothetical protein